MGINDVSRALKGWLQKLSGTRTSGTYIKGRWVPGTTESFTFGGVPQNATADDLRVLEEGNRTDEAIKIHTTFQLIAEIKGKSNGDTISYKGSNWKVFNVAYRDIGNYNKAIAVKQ